MRRKTVKRFLAGSLAVVMSIALAGCGNSGDSGSSGSSGSSSSGSSSSGSSGSSGGEASGDGNQIVKFSMMNYTGGNASDVPKTTLVEEAVKEMVKENTGLEYEADMQYVHMGDYAEKLKVLMAGGDIPDVVHCGWFGMAEVNKYGAQGLYVDFTQYKELMPNLFSMLEKDSTFAERGFSDDGKLYILPDIVMTKGGSYDSYSCGGFRKDILDKHNLPVPTTLDELYEVASALKKEYPDIYPIMTLEEWEPLENAVFHSYGIASNNGNYFNGQEFVYSALQDGYKESVEYLHKLYAEGLIAPDYQIHTSDQGMAAIANGEAFLIPQIWNGYPSQWAEEYPDQEWVLVPILGNQTGTMAPFIYHPTSDDYSLSSGYFTIISNNSPVKEDLMKIYDQYFTEEQSILRAWGIEGVTYENGEDGERHLIDKEKYRDVNTGTNPSADNRVGNVELSSTTKIYYNGEMQEEYLYNFWRNVYTDKLDVPYYKSVTLSEDENEEYANIMTAVDTYVDEQRAKFITGERSMDEWDAFIEELQGMGDIQRALDIRNSKL